MDFLALVEKLRDFWKKQGCVLWYNQNLEVGAGTFNHATFFGVLGDKPTKVGYLEPCRRPTDGRYGKNPNRLQQYFQFQVILKPSPENGQNLLLESLRSLGVSFSKNDLRFVKDDWKSPTLGAAGLGWEVWLNGMEITQFTYFQQMAGQTLRPVSLEITYGLERIFLAMEAQKKGSFEHSQVAPATQAKSSSDAALSVYNLPFDGKVTYGDVFLEREKQYSKYNFEIADIRSHLLMFAALENEAKLCYENKLPYPAYDNVIKCSHVFNMLDARGVISVTERENYISRIRKLATETALAYTTLTK